MSSSSAAQKPDLNKKVHELPHRPGVYLMRDRFKRVIYVGKAKNLRKRVGSYFMPSRAGRADLKTQALLDTVWDFDFQEVKSEAEAILLEGQLIKEYRPRYNISFRDDKRFLLVKVNMRDPFPRFQTTRLKREGDGARYFGPFSHSGALRSTLNWVLKNYGIRSCRPRVPGEEDYRHCNNDIIKNCSAPCVGKVTPEQYLERVDQACSFLEGQSREMIDFLERQMREAAQRMDFEKAAQLRDMLEDLKVTTAPKRKFVRPKLNLPSTVNPKEDAALLGDALQLPQPPRIMECFDISNISTTHIVASMVSFRDGAPDKANYRRYRIKTVDGQNDFASMAEVIRRRYSRILLEQREFAGSEVAEETQESPMEANERLAREADREGKRFVRLPDLIIVDGGKGQLGFAVAELRKLGLSEIPIIGLAKQFEEVYRPGRPDPLRLPHDSGALMLLQRIRDEAHRFANTYHRLLLKKRMDESVLDDIPGVSANRKRLLLEAFGSVERIRKSTPAKIAEIEGISERFAEDLLRHLNEREAQVDADADAPGVPPEDTSAGLPLATPAARPRLKITRKPRG
jgi:excinuclease ABC subunit C